MWNNIHLVGITVGSVQDHADLCALVAAAKIESFCRSRRNCQCLHAGIVT